MEDRREERAREREREIDRETVGRGGENRESRMRAKGK